MEARAGVEPTYTDLQSRKHILSCLGNRVNAAFHFCIQRMESHICHQTVKFSPTTVTALPTPISPNHERMDMDAKTKRQHLNEYHAAARRIELSEACIGLLEAVRTTAAYRCVKIMKADQQRHLRDLDKQAEALGAPYGA
jgi:hypothetical protein